MVHFDVTYTQGEFNNNKNTITGLADGAINVLATTQNLGRNTDGVSVITNGYALSAINISIAGPGVLGHEIAHHFLGHTRSSTVRAMSEYGGLAGNIISNVFADLIIGQSRHSLATVGGFFGTRADHLAPGQPLPVTSPFNSGATALQQFLTKQEAIRPRK